MTGSESLVAMDLGNMAIFDKNIVIIPSENEISREEMLLAASKTALETLLESLFSLPLPEGHLRGLGASALVALPKPTTIIPRAKPIPVPRESTPWELFSRAKGIKKRSREERYAYNEQKKKWLPKHGHLSEKRKDAKDATWCQELKPGQSMEIE